MDIDPTTDYVEYFWDKHCDLYHDNTNTCMKSLMTTLNGLLRVKQHNTIREAGCCPGMTSKLLSLDYKKDATVYCIDLAPSMVKRAVRNLEEYDDFNANQSNHWEYVPSQNIPVTIDVKEDNIQIRQNKNGKVFKFME